MPYLLDSNIVIGHLHGLPEMEILVDRLQPEGVAISSVSFMEVFDGILSDPERVTIEEQFTSFLVVIPVLPFAQREAELCARLRAELRRRGQRTRARYLDLMIAATAMAHGLTLVTRNVADYGDLPGLTLVIVGEESNE